MTPLARNLLTDRLTKLVEHGVLEKQLYQDHPPRYEYRLTRKGIDLSPALVALMRWGDKWLADGEPPVSLLHDRCGEPLDQAPFHVRNLRDDPPPHRTERSGPHGRGRPEHARRGGRPRRVRQARCRMGSFNSV